MLAAETGVSVHKVNKEGRDEITKTYSDRDCISRRTCYDRITIFRINTLKFHFSDVASSIWESGLTTSLPEKDQSYQIVSSKSCEVQNSERHRKPNQGVDGIGWLKQVGRGESAKHIHGFECVEQIE